MSVQYLRFPRRLFQVISLIMCFVSSTVYAIEISEANLNKPVKYFILSIDGGGIRGIIPARILQEIEIRTGKPIYQLFDLIVGTSTGGVIATALATPNEKQEAKYRAKDLVALYKDRGKEIFDRSLWRRIHTGIGLWGSKYKRDNLDNILDEMLGDALLSETLKPIMVLSYSIDQGETHLWTTDIARTSDNKDFYLRDIASATSAAPTYFEPKKLTSKTGSRTYYEADGGIFANNPAIMALSQARRINPSLNNNDIVLVSIGTGKAQLTKTFKELKNSGVIGWVMRADLIDVMMSTSSEISEWQSTILNLNTVRIQLDLDKESGEMDNVSEVNIQRLLHVTEDYITNNSHALDELYNKLLQR